MSRSAGVSREEKLAHLCKRAGCGSTLVEPNPEGYWECVACGELEFDERLGRPPSSSINVADYYVDVPRSKRMRSWQQVDKEYQG